MEAVLAGVLARQAAQGHRATLVTGAAGPASGGVVRLSMRGWGPARALVGLREALVGADVVHVHGVDGLLAQAAATRPAGARLVVSTHGGFFHQAPDSAARAALLRLLRPGLACADAVWFSSEADAARFGAAGVTGEVVPNGVDVASAPPHAPVPGRWVVPGRVDHHKGHLALLRALAGHAGALGGPWVLDVVGAVSDPALLRRLRAAVRALGLTDRVTFHGAVDRASWWRALATAELAWFPSTYEGFGVAVVEAMAAGAPVVVQPIAAHRLLVQPGRTGAWLDLQRPLPDFAERVREARAAGGAWGAAGREAASRWSWASVGPLWDAALARVVG
jgi:alpha-1,3-mannosyltransferase